MNSKLTKLLVEKYPELFKEVQYFACGDGWFDVTECLSKQLIDSPLVTTVKSFHI